ncbi:hypothetical protein [Asaia sp. HN128]|uniref:hypothetical protein n=1 Tax=Asaia sp. HN128 TaxID=3081234 RepID=UPI00301A3A26
MRLKRAPASDTAMDDPISIADDQNETWKRAPADSLIERVIDLAELGLSAPWGANTDSTQADDNLPSCDHAMPFLPCGLRPEDRVSDRRARLLPAPAMTSGTVRCGSETTFGHTLSGSSHSTTRCPLQKTFDFNGLADVSSNCHTGVIKASQEAAQSSG